MSACLLTQLTYRGRMLQFLHGLRSKKKSSARRNRDPHGSGSNASSALRSALHYLRAKDSAALGGAGGRSWYESFPLQVGWFKSWAQTSRQGILSADDWLPRFEAGGQEHDVWETDDNRIFKTTKRNSYGFRPVRDAESGRIGMRPALPMEYLERLELQNTIFGDDWQLEGVAENAGGSLYVITSQPFVTGQAASQKQISNLMKSFCSFSQLAKWRAFARSVPFN
jgi:hypothetical protein